MKLYPFIAAEKPAVRNVKKTCTLLCVSRSAFYQSNAWLTMKHLCFENRHNSRGPRRGRRCSSTSRSSKTASACILPWGTAPPPNTSARPSHHQRPPRRPKKCVRQIGATPENLPGYSGTAGTAASPILVTCNLSAWSGDNVILAFRFMSDPAVGEPGWFVRNVQIDGTEESFPLRPHTLRARAELGDGLRSAAFAVGPIPSPGALGGGGWGVTLAQIAHLRARAESALGPSRPSSRSKAPPQSSMAGVPVCSSSWLTTNRLPFCPGRTQELQVATRRPPFTYPAIIRRAIALSLWASLLSVRGRGQAEVNYRPEWSRRR